MANALDLEIWIVYVILIYKVHLLGHLCTNQFITADQMKKMCYYSPV